jgi:hypothetical protein
MPMETGMNPRLLAPALVLSLAGATFAAPRLPPPVDYEAARSRHDALAARYRALVSRASAIRHPLPMDEVLEIPLELPPAPGPLGALGEEGLPRLPAQVLAALRKRIETEQERGYRQWELLAKAPARYRTHQPRDVDGHLVWSRDIFENWVEFTPEPSDLPELPQLVRDLEHHDGTARSPASAEGLPRIEAELIRAIRDSEAYRPRIEVRGGKSIWVNAGYWKRLRARARRWAFAMRGVVELAGEHADDTLVAQLARELPRIQVPEKPGDAWDRRVDTELLPRLPLGLRVVVERRLSGAYFRGAWQAKYDIHQWWLRHGRTAEEFADVRQGKREVDLQGTYRYAIEAPRGHTRAALRTKDVAQAG